MPSTPTDFIDGLFAVAGNGSAASNSGIGIHMYAANASMQGRYFYNADAEMLIVPQQGRLRLLTEFGVIDIEPQEIALLPRGVRVRVELLDGEARGYACENFGAQFRLPDLQIILHGILNALFKRPSFDGLATQVEETKKRKKKSDETLVVHRLNFERAKVKNLFS